MKQLLTILLVLVFLTVCGCSLKTNNNESNASDTAAIVTSGKETNNTSQNESNASFNSTSTERSETQTEITSSAHSVHTLSNTDLTADNIKTEPNSSVEKPASNGVTNKMPIVSEATSTDNDTKPPTPNADVDTPQKATAKDAEKIAETVVKYINEYRNSEGAANAVVLPGLTEYANYRSQQLVTNFAHNTLDERAASTSLKYGEYIDPLLYGMTGEPYYTANAREAIGKGSLFGTAEQTAKRIADGFKNSKGHWCYVGNEEYKYIAVGITCKNGFWYCDIAVSTVNTDN